MNSHAMLSPQAILYILEFSDRPRAIRVHRRSSEDRTRTPVATINKATLAVVVDHGVELSAQEATEIGEVAELQRQAEALQRHVWALRLPMVLREAVDYCEAEAALAEVKILAHAVTQAHSRLRRMIAQREAEKPGWRPAEGEPSLAVVEDSATADR